MSRSEIEKVPINWIEINGRTPEKRKTIVPIKATICHVFKILPPILLRAYQFLFKSLTNFNGM
jgi:hypothetical protein